MSIQHNVELAFIYCHLSKMNVTFFKSENSIFFETSYYNLVLTCNTQVGDHIYCWGVTRTLEGAINQGKQRLYKDYEFGVIG